MVAAAMRALMVHGVVPMEAVLVVVAPVLMVAMITLSPIKRFSEEVVALVAIIARKHFGTGQGKGSMDMVKFISMMDTLGVKLKL
ncbi:hypothetical protein Tco_1269916 [Tanacetum coccineum]